MSKSKNWKAVVADTLISSELTLTVSDEINTGGSHQHEEFRKKIPQGITKNQLILVAGSDEELSEITKIDQHIS